MNDRSFVRFGGLAGILLALTSWTTVAVYYTLVPPAQRVPVTNPVDYLASLAQNSFGTQLYYGLYALIAVWAFVGIVAMYFRVRSTGEAWAFFATLLGAIAGFATILNALQQLANARYLASLYPSAKDFALAAFSTPAPINPVGAVTFGLTAPWFLIVSLLMLKRDFPKLLAYLGFVAFADLAVGFVASLANIAGLDVLTAVIAGAVGGPIFWLWLGVILWRDAGNNSTAK